jgi:hypothetical protein
MTVDEAYDRGITRLRKAQWNEFAHLDLPPADARGLHGPWAVLVDPPAQKARGFEPERILLLNSKYGIDTAREQFEEWTPPARYEELFGRVPNYADHWKLVNDAH